MFKLWKDDSKKILLMAQEACKDVQPGTWEEVALNLTSAQKQYYYTVYEAAHNLWLTDPQYKAAGYQFLVAHQYVDQRFIA